MRNWTDEERKRQAEIIRKTKPWEKSTGPKTREGKEKTRNNALKSGNYTQANKHLYQTLKINRAFTKHVLAWVMKDEEAQKLLRNRSVKKMMEKQRHGFKKNKFVETD